MNKTEYLEYCNEMYAKGSPVLPNKFNDRLVENTRLENKVVHPLKVTKYKHPSQCIHFKKSL